MLAIMVTGDVDMYKKIFKTEIIVVVFILVLLISTLMVKPVIGVADNGDFDRIMKSVGLEYLTKEYGERYFGHIHREYGMQDVFISPKGYYFSSSVPIVAAAVSLKKLVNNNGIFDIRFLAFVYSILFLFTVYLLLRHNKQKIPFANWVLAALVVLVFADIGYISYFNSLFSEPVSFLFMLMTVGLGLIIAQKEKPSIWLLIGFYAAAIFLVGSKLQNAPTGMLIILLGLRLWFMRREIKWRAVIIVASVLLVATMGASYKLTSGALKACNMYHSVFIGILKDSPDVEKDLAELGLNKELAVLAETRIYQRDLPIDPMGLYVREEFFGKISRTDVILFYMKHPLRYLQKLDNTAKLSFYIRPDYLGNYEKAEGIKYRQMTKTFSLWSSIKGKIFPKSLIFLVLFYLAYFAVVIRGYFKSKSLSRRFYLDIFMILGLTCISQLMIPVLGDGETDLLKHMFFFNVCFDIMFTVSVLWVVNKAFKLRDRLAKSETAGLSEV